MSKEPMEPSEFETSNRSNSGSGDSSNSFTSSSSGSNSSGSKIENGFTSSSFTSSSSNSFTSSSSNSFSSNSFTSSSNNSFTSSSNNSFTSPGSGPSSSSFSSTSFSSPSDKLSTSSTTSSSSKMEEDGWACGACTFINPELTRICEICTNPRPGMVQEYDEDKRFRGHGGSSSSSGSSYSGSSGGGGSSYNGRGGYGDDDPIGKYVFSKAPYPEYEAIEWTRMAQCDVWMEGMGWVLGTMVKIEPEKVCFHINNHKGGVWRNKNDDTIAPLNTQTKGAFAVDPNKQIVPYVPQPSFGGSSTSTSTTTTSTTTTTSNPYASPLGVLPEGTEGDKAKDQVMSSTPKKEKKINIDSNPSSYLSASTSTASTSSTSSTSIGTLPSITSSLMSSSSATTTPPATTSAGSGSAPMETEEPMWECLNCTLKNPERAGNCVVCQTLRFQDEY